MLDLYSRGVVGLAMDKTIAGTLTRQALTQAILQRRPSKGLICHSDRGSFGHDGRYHPTDDAAGCLLSDRTGFLPTRDILGNFQGDRICLVCTSGHLPADRPAVCFQSEKNA